MHLAPLLLYSYAIVSTASPLSEISGHVDGEIHTSNAPAKVEREGRLLKRANTILNALGTFGPQGLLGSIDANGNIVPQTSNGNNPDDEFQPGICFSRGSCETAAVVDALEFIAAGLESTITFLKRLVSFHNNDADWPMYPNGDVLWSIRTFRTTDCGQTGVRPGINPSGSDSTGPYMMSEYKSNDFTYHNNKPCENFMFADPSKINGVQVQSTAVWLHPSVQNGYVFLYTNPVCDATVINNKTENQFTSDDSNLVAIYNGQGALFQGDSTPSTVESGVWACLNANAASWNAFSVVQVGTTDMTIPTDYYQNGHIPGSETQPKNRAPGKGANTYKNMPWAAYTWEQVGPAPYNSLADPNSYIIGESTGGD